MSNANYEIKILDIGDTNRASICAIHGDTVYEHPLYANLAKHDAEKAFEELPESDKISSYIERCWNCLV